MLTTENYPNVAHPSYRAFASAGKRAAAGWAVFYFLAFWYLATFIVLAIVTAVIASPDPKTNPNPNL